MKGGGGGGGIVKHKCKWRERGREREKGGREGECKVVVLIQHEIHYNQTGHPT